MSIRPELNRSSTNLTEWPEPIASKRTVLPRKSFWLKSAFSMTNFRDFGFCKLSLLEIIWKGKKDNKLAHLFWSMALNVDLVWNLVYRVVHRSVHKSVWTRMLTNIVLILWFNLIIQMKSEIKRWKVRRRDKGGLKMHQVKSEENQVLEE